MGALIFIDMKKYLQDRGLLFWMLILPIIFTVLFIAGLTSGTEAAVRDQIILSIVPGYTVMFVFFILINMAEAVLRDRNLGMTARIASTPLSPYLYLLGKWIPNMIIVFIQIVILLLFGKLVYNIPLEQPFYLLLLAVFLTFTVTGIGLALALLVKTNNMGIAITQVVALGGGFLGGQMMPLETMPAFMQTISKFLPQFWAHQGFQEAMKGTLPAMELFQIALILFGFGLVGFIIALLRYPFFLKQARG
ncbi:ABC transporter permease [Virgibacillus sp. NKC19-3]|uniref:ABC transporter permease n=1 Tax=Virgibacillus saliphilus TaxID=2831674 RepID=UPI001C9BAF39|nr:ABC transporter permease [Virgibacillus sp. NKC19-3]MBY7142169.1 ABC transporter permease [Virgibacillus sp. NKC19-3]